MNLLVMILCAVATVVAISLLVQFLLSRREIRRLKETIGRLTLEIDALKTETSSLAKYKVILAADEEAARILSLAKEEAAKTEQELTQMKDEVKKEVKALKEAAVEKYDSATIEAGKILEEAQKRAQEIAGAAYEAMNNAELYGRAEKAMRNKMEGYGDEYLIPTHSLLDDLAAEYGHTQAGKDLEIAREKTKAMVRNGTAALCDYVEANRKETAINFVTDAFNGKVDSILSRVKSVNFGKLSQEIEDAFVLVNINGKAFRNARVADEYRRARLEELRLAVIVQELREAEREEQRRIKEQIREEEKVRRECERAIKDAEKEEEMLRKALEKVEEKVAQASTEQKAKYELQLQELTEILKLAEERNQRALSMAQQTKQGHVYIISNIGSFGEAVVKIGVTRRLEPLDRIRELGDASVPFEFDVHALISSDNAPALESTLHKHFVLNQMNKVNHRKEFFRVSLKEIHEELDRIGVNAKWTMLAEAREYRETKSIEQLIEKDPKAKEAWIRRELSTELGDSMASESIDA